MSSTRQATVLVIGARGQLGTAIVREFEPSGRVVALGRSDLDITDDRAVRDRIRAEAPTVVINCTAYNLVDAAETDPVAALAANALAVRSMAQAAIASGATFVHYSTDFVFDGQTDRPYTEADRPNPLSVYATSKLLGEWFAADVPRYYVLRVESLFGAESVGAKGRGSVAAIVSALRAGREAPVFEDRTVSPTYIVDCAAATRRLLGRDAPSGLYHCVNSGLCSWLEFGREAARLLGVPPLLKPVRVADVSLPARRPQFCALSNQKLADAGAPMPPWQHALARYLEAFRHEIPD